MKSGRRLARFARRTILTVSCLYLGGLLVFYLIQDRILHHPSGETRAKTAARAAEVGLEPWPSLDDYRCLVAAGAGEDPPRVLVGLHGNAGSAVGQAAMIARFRPLQARVFLYEFPGYGSREGGLREQELVADLTETLDLIAAEHPGKPVLLMGESLGSAVLCGALERSRARIVALLLVTPFTTLGDVAQKMFWFLPARLLLRDDYDNLEHLRRSRRPLAMVVAGRDGTTPPELGRRLFAAYPGPKQLTFLPESRHFDWRHHLSEEAWRRILDFLDQAVAGNEIEAGDEGR